MIKAIFFLSIIISAWNVIGGPPPIIAKITFTEEELVIDGTGLEDTKSVSIRTLENKILKDYEVDNANPEKIVARPLAGSFEPGDKKLYLIITDSEGELFYPITLKTKSATQAVYKITQRENAKIPNKIVVDEKSEINFSPGDNSGRYYYNYSIYANRVGDLAIKNEDKDLLKIDQAGNLEISGNLKVKGRTLRFKNQIITPLNFENQLFPVLPTNHEGDLRVKDVVIGVDNNISGVVDFTSSGNMDVATSTFHVESSTGRVGIGNATPTYKLDVLGATNSGIRLRQAAVSTNTSTEFFNGMVFEEPFGKSFGIGYGAGDLFSINSFDGTYRNIFSLNNVGNGVIAGSLKVGAYTLPSTDGTSGQVLSTNGSGTASWTSAGAGIGDVVGPASSTLDHLASFSSGTGKAIKDSGINSANLPTMVAPAASSSTIILSGGADKKPLTTTNYMIPSTIGSPTYVLKSDGTNAIWEQDNPGTQSLIAPTRGIATGLLPMFLTADGHVITDSDVEAINVPEMTSTPTAANQIIISTGNGKHLTTTIYPISPTIGATGTVLKSDGTGASWQPEVSVADFATGPALSTPFALARYADMTGKILKDSPVVMDDFGNFNFLRAVSNTVGSHPCPSMSSLEKDALSSPLEGDCVFDTDLGQTNYWGLGRWGNNVIVTPLIAGKSYKKAELVSYETLGLFAAKDFTASASPTDDYFNGNINFQSLLPVTTCTSNGGGVSLSGGNIDAIAGRGLIVTSTPGNAWPNETRVTWSNATSIIPAIANNWNTVYVDEGGVVRVTPGKPTPTILRTQIVLAGVHPSLSLVEDHRGPCFDSGSTIRDLNYVLGHLKKGFEYSGNVGLTMARNPGEIYGTGINFDGQNQTIRNFPAELPAPITYYMTRNARIGGTQTNVNPNQWDNGAGLVSTTNANKWTYQRVYLVAGGVTAIQYGQKEYSTRATAISGVTTDAPLFVVNPNLAGVAKWVATIVLKSGTPDLNLADNAFINCGIFGCSEGGGGGSSGGGGGGDVFGPGSSVANHLATFSDITGKLIEDSGINSANLATMATGALANQIIISAGAKALSSTIYQIPPAIGASGTVLKSDGTNATWETDFGGTGDVVGPASASSTNLAAFSGTTGKLIGDSGIKYTNLTTMTTGAVGANQIIISAGGKELSSTIYQIPLAIGSNGTVLKSDGTNAFWQADTDTTQGASDVQGPTSATDNALVRFDDTTGKLIQGSGVIISDTNDISGVQNFTAKGSNTNTGAANTSAVTFMTGRSNSGALNTNQTTADVSFEYGAANGGYKHYISTTHSGTASLNSMNFWINNTTVSGSSTPGTGNDLAVSMTPVGVGILTQSPFQELDVQGDIVTSFHGNASQHNAAELGTRMIGHISGTTEFAGMKVNVKALESDGTTARANNADIGFHVWGNSLWGSKEVIRISERGRLGINTTNPTELLTVNGNVALNGVSPVAPNANVGAANVKILGANGSTAGPHLIFNDNSDIYPQRHLLNWAHDNIWDCWDCYYDGSARNSTSSAAFRIIKDANNWVIQSIDTVGVAKGSVINPPARFWVNKTGTVFIAGTLTAGTGVGANDILGNGDLSRIALEEAKSFNPVVLANCNGWPGGCATNPLSTHPTANGMYLSNANWSGTLYLPVAAAAGEAFYFQSAATSTANLQIDNSNLTSPLAVPNGWTQTFVSDGARWNYAGQKTNGAFNAVRVWPTSTTNIGFGANGQQLTTNGAGSLTWTAAASDKRLKENITPLTNAEKIINSLVPVEFNWNEQGLKATGQNDKLHRGLIAQEVEKILPGSIRGDKIKIINYDEVTAALVKYVQQLEKRIKILENK